MEKVKDEEMMRNNIMSNRQPRMRNNQPLFLNYDQEEAGESLSPIKQRQEVLEANAGDNCVEVFVSVVENPGQFWVQNIGSMSVELDKNDKEITDFYSEITNRKLMAVTSVQVGDIVAAQFSLEERFYRARIVSIQVAMINLLCIISCLNFRRILMITISPLWSFSLLIMERLKRKVSVKCLSLNMNSSS